MSNNNRYKVSWHSEPIINGANIIAGSLIKNLGGTIVPTGGYIAGDSELVEMAAVSYTHIRAHETEAAGG